jgi:hypothetical protein
MFNPKFERYGVIRVENSRVRIYSDPYNSETIYIGQPISHAMWNGGEVTVYLANGSIRRYRDYLNYIIVR